MARTGKISGRIMEFEIRKNRERIDTGIYSKRSGGIKIRRP
jgi:hypothetical protein